MSNRIRSRYLLIFMILAVCVVVYACGKMIYKTNNINEDGPAGGSSNSQGKVILDYYIWDDEESYIVPVVNAYSALQSSVKINLHVLDNDIYDEEIKVLLSQDIKIDLLGVRGISKLVQLQNQGHILNLTSYVRNNDMDVTAYGSMFNDIAVDGNYYGIPTRSTCWILIYNKDIFDEANITYPKQMTWKEYRQLAISLTKGEGGNKIWGGYWVPWCYNFAAIQQSSYLIDDDLTYTRQSLELLNNFYNIDKSHMSYKQMTEQGTDYRNEFEKGTIAMMPEGEWIINMLMMDQKEGLTDVNWDIAPMPVFEGQKSDTTWGQYQFVGIASDSSHPQEAFDFIQFLCGEEGARIYAENGMIHAYSNEKIKKIYMNTVGKDSVSIFFEAKKVQEELAVSSYQEVKKAFYQYADEYFLGNKTIEETMSSFNEIRREILNK